MSSIKLVNLNTGVILERNGEYYIFADVHGENYVTYYNVICLNGSGRWFQTPKNLEEAYEEIKDKFTIVSGKVTSVKIE